MGGPNVIYTVTQRSALQNDINKVSRVKYCVCGGGALASTAPPGSYTYGGQVHLEVCTVLILKHYSIASRQSARFSIAVYREVCSWFVTGDRTQGDGGGRGTQHVV